MFIILLFGILIAFLLSRVMQQEIKLTSAYRLIIDENICFI